MCVINASSQAKVPSFSTSRFVFRELLKASDASSGVSYVKSAVQYLQNNNIIGALSRKATFY